MDSSWCTVDRKAKHWDAFRHLGEGHVQESPGPTPLSQQLKYDRNLVKIREAAQAKSFATFEPLIPS